jgi:hypothetical protein
MLEFGRLAQVRSIALQGALKRNVEDGSECRSRGLERNLLYTDVRLLALKLHSIAVTRNGSYEPEYETFFKKK